MFKSCLFSAMYVSVIFMQSLFASDENVLSTLFPKNVTTSMKYMTVNGAGQLGNQCFRVAAALSHALDNGYFFAITPVVKNTYPEIFYKFQNIIPIKGGAKTLHLTPHFKGYQEIKDSTCITGFPNSTKYFEGNVDIIRSFFQPKPLMKKRLKRKFKYIFNAPEKYVGLHLRTFVQKGDFPIFTHCKGYFPAWGTSPLYYENAINQFDKDVTFVVFTDYVPAAQEMLSIYDRKFIFTDNSLEEDFYLISMMDNMIIANSSFAVFAAYLNGNSNQKVVAPKNSKDTEIGNKDWIRLENDNDPINIGSEYDEWYEICKNHARDQGFIE